MPEIEADLAETLAPLGLEWTLTDQSVPKRMAILASTSRPLPARPALAPPPRRAAGHDPDGDLQPHQHRRRCPLVRHPLLPRPLAGPRQVRGRGQDPRAAQGQRRLRRARPLHADPLRRLPRRGRRAGDQHPPLLPARLHRRRALPQGEGTRREAHRRDLALRHQGPRRGPDHRAGRHPRQPRDDRRRPASPAAPTSNAPCSPAPCNGTRRTASSGTATTPSSSDRP